jgi:membrane protease YdiL (CAAX protease family)
MMRSRIESIRRFGLSFGLPLRGGAFVAMVIVAAIVLSAELHALPLTPKGIDHAVAREADVLAGPSAESWFTAVWLGGTVAVAVLAWRHRWWRIGAGAEIPFARMPWLGAGFFALLFAQVFGAVAGRAFVGEDASLRSLAIVMLASQAAQLPLAFLLARDLPVSPLSVRRRIALGALTMLAAWPVVQFVAALAGALQERLSGTPAPSLGHETLQRLLDAPGNPWAIGVIVSAVVLGPITEEFAYRGALQGAFRAVGLRAWPAIIVTSAAFLLMHLPALPTAGLAATLCGLFVLSLALGLIRERTRSLLPAIVAHAIFNALNLLLAYAATIAADPPVQ